MDKVGICYHPALADDLGRRVADELAAIAARHVGETWTAPAWDEEATSAQMPGTDLVVCIGGDGTILRAARSVVPHDVLLLGVNMGRLGFLTELDARGAVERLPDVIAGEGRIEERAMLHAQLMAREADDGDDTPARHDALNDIVIGRVTLGRTVQVLVRVDGTELADFRADGVIVATATGSTAYSLSAGASVLPPESRELLLTPVAPHLASRNSIVLPAEAVVDVELVRGPPVTFSIDGEREMDLGEGEKVRMELSPHRARFVRLGPPGQFYERLAQRLNWLRPADAGDADRAARSVLGEETPA